jgi:hypothetical protein
VQIQLSFDIKHIDALSVDNKPLSPYCSSKCASMLQPVVARTTFCIRAFYPATYFNTELKFCKDSNCQIECGMHQIIGGFHGGYLLGIKDLGTIYH